MSAPHVSAPPPDARFVCESFALGEPAGEMTPVAGGLSNRMWRLVTDRGAFAIKQLELANANPVWPPWIERAFRFECSAFEHGVPMPRPISVAATGGCLAEIADDAGVVTSLRAHAWVEGRPLARVVHGAATSERVGAMLAGVHAVHSVVEDFDGGDGLHVLGESHWLERAERVERARADWARMFRDAFARLASAAEPLLRAPGARDRVTLFALLFGLKGLRRWLARPDRAAVLTSFTQDSNRLHRRWHLIRRRPLRHRGGPLTTARPSVGRRIVVTGLAGAGKSTFSKALSAKTGLPLIHLDLHFWKPGWVEPADDEWTEKQCSLLAGDEWIADGNYASTLALRLERAETVVFLDTPWWLCAWRAFRRGVRPRPAGFQLPEGCPQPFRKRLRDEWWLVGAIWRARRSDRERELSIVSTHGRHAALHLLRSKREVRDFLDELHVLGRLDLE